MLYQPDLRAWSNLVCQELEIGHDGGLICWEYKDSLISELWGSTLYLITKSKFSNSTQREGEALPLQLSWLWAQIRVRVSDCGKPRPEQSAGKHWEREMSDRSPGHHASHKRTDVQMGSCV